MTLDLLVLWRGAPGWFVKGGQQSESGGGDGRGHVNYHFLRGGVEVQLTLDRQTGVVRVGGNEVTLGDANVLLVDDVDVPGNMTIAGTRRLEPRIENDLLAGISAMFRSAPDLIPFLRCDATVPAAAGEPPAAAAFRQKAFSANCDRILGK